MSTQQQGELVPEWTVGDRLRKAREHLGLDQGPFAAMIGVSRGTVSNYERGSVDRYKPIVMRAWAEHTGVLLDWIETGQGNSMPPEPPRGLPDPGLARLTDAKRSRVRSARHATRQYLPFMPATAAAA